MWTCSSRHKDNVLGLACTQLPLIGKCKSAQDCTVHSCYSNSHAAPWTQHTAVLFSIPDRQRQLFALDQTTVYDGPAAHGNTVQQPDNLLS